MRKSTAIRLKIFSIALVLALGVTHPSRGQDDPAVAGADAQQKVAGGEEIKFSLDVNSRLGSFTYVPDQWGELQLRLENDGNASKELLCTSYFGDLSTLQFGRRLWLPAHSRLILPHPILFPDADQIPGGRAIIRSLVFDDTQGKEVLVKSAAGRLQHDRTLLVAPVGRHTGIVAGWDVADIAPQEVVDLVVADRVYQGLDNKVTFLAGQFLPADETSLNYLDHLVLADDRLVNDLAALTAVRRWLHAGGRLWIMLDRTGPELLERLFGDEFEGTVVDQVGLTSVRVDNPLSVQGPEGVAGETIEYDVPVEMARMAASGMTVRNTVNGWPAALTRSYGEGHVLITTLGPRGWMKPTPAVPAGQEDKRPLDMRSEFMPLSPMEDIAPIVFARREAELLPPEALEPFAAEFISYDVPSGTLIIGSMCGFLVLLAAMGSGLWRWGRLEHFGWCGSLLAVLFAVLFFGIGLSNRHGTTDTIASIQLAQAIAGTDDVRTHGAIAVYRAEGGQSLIQTSQGGEFVPDTVGADGATTRMVTTDLGTFQWDGLSQPAGLGMYQVITSGSDVDRLAARATLDAQGIVGKCGARLSAGTDAVLVTRRGRMGVQLTAGGNFRANADDVLGPDQYLSATFLDDVQNRRRRILQQLFSDPDWKNALHQPQLLMWVQDWGHGLQFGEDLQRQGDTLLIAPLEFNRPAAGTEVVIPSPLLDYVTRRPPDGSSASGFWDDDRQEWQERSGPSTTWLSVQVPQEFLPFQATQARLEINVSGLMGQIEILGVKDDKVVSLQAVTDPVGTVVIDIDDPESLMVSEDGELAVGISAGVPLDSSQADSVAEGSFNADTASKTWKVHSLSVRLWGTTSNPTEED